MAFDRQTGYRSCSFLTVPLRNERGDVIGVLQLVNALTPAGDGVTTFAPSLEPVVEALCFLAAAALEVYAREQSLREQIRDLHIRIDEAKRERAVTEIADTEYFRELQRRARELKGS
jgi:GAF domain-containing protein